MTVHETAMLENASVDGAEVREYVTIHDASVGPDSRIYERTSVKKSTIGESVDVNANAYVENAVLGDYVQVGPNAAVVGVTHALTGEGMEHRNDRFEEVVIEEGAFVGAGAVVLPGVHVGEDAVVGANVTVTEDIESGAILRGSGG